MKISYDEDVDAMYISLIDGDHEVRTVRLNEDVALDLDEQERLVGIEILDAKRVIGKGKLPRVVIDSLALTKAMSPAALTTRKLRARTAARRAPRLRKAG
jgi:uncharacterized protein YuzE